ncbi:MAG: hypothetical protein PHO96_04080, partial [Candidatus Izemoplasmatales bacterium]|nr:hypothetical protein [Candidatus Izemoplasmatales bacterium]
MNLFYQPDNGYLADVIPFYEAGYYYLFYLHDYRNRSKNGEGTPWYLVRTKDFVHFEEFGEVLPRGGKESQDLYVFTGSVFKKGEHDYYLFYTGHNPHYTTKPQQAIMSARSTDLIHWQKDPDATFFAPIDQFESDDWRDPFVFYDHHQDTYKMLLASRLKDGGRRRRGATVMMRSDDLLNWHVERLLYAPEMYYTHECPDYFSIGKYWYLIYSEFSHHRVTHYRISEHLDGPWLMPS